MKGRSNFIKNKIEANVKTITENQLKDGITSGIDSPETGNPEVIAYKSSDNKSIIVQADNRISKINVFSITGYKLISLLNHSETAQVNVNDFYKGAYILQVYVEGKLTPKTIKIINT